jgi:hypothetical protein
MSVDIDDAFVKQYESEVKLAYQRMGSKLGNTVRKKTNVKGKDTTFQTMGSGLASQKSRNGELTPMNLSHTPVTCTLQDWYAADYIDELDELKINHDERMVVTQSGAAALGRRSDLLITTAMDGGTNTEVHGSVGMTQAKVNVVFESFGENDVPDDGDRFAAIAPQAWTDLLSISAFSDADFIGTDDLPYKGGMVARRWLGFMWFTFSGLEIASTTRNNYLYHRSAVGCASGAEISTRADYVPTKAAHLFTSKLSQGAVIIDNVGLYTIETTES